MDRLTAMRVFVTVVDLGSQSAAADHLDLSRPVVSRYLAELETWVGARLMQRTTRRLSLTGAGQETLARCRQMLELADDLQASLCPQGTPRGELRISVSTSFGQRHMVDAVADYIRLYPGVRIDLQVQDRTVNLVDERIDLAIRTTNHPDPSLIARRLGTCRSVLCAAPGYPQPHAVQGLAELNCLTHSYVGASVWHLWVEGQLQPVAVQGNFSANEATTLQRAAMAGLGIAMLPTYIAADALRSGALVRVLPQVEPQTLDLYAVYTSRKHMPPTLRSMLAFLAERFGDEPEWDRGL